MSNTAGFKLRVIETAEQSGNRSAKRMRFIFQHFFFFFRCPCLGGATYSPVRPIHRQMIIWYLFHCFIRGVWEIDQVL